MSTEQLTGLQLAVKLLAQRAADLEAERNEWRRIASAYSPAKELAASLKQAKASGDAARKERDELRAKYDELLVALHGIGAALGIPEGDRSPYSVTCGVLERVIRLAEIEAQEPLFYYRPIKGGSMYEGPHWAKSVGGQMLREEKPGEWKPLYARPVPAIPAGEPAGAVPGEWIEWAGGECPIADGVRHQVLFRDGDVSQICNEAASWSWLHDAEDCDIVAYRVLA